MEGLHEIQVKKDLLMTPSVQPTDRQHVFLMSHCMLQKLNTRMRQYIIMQDVESLAHLLLHDPGNDIDVPERHFAHPWSSSEQKHYEIDSSLWDVSAVYILLCAPLLPVY